MRFRHPRSPRLPVTKDGCSLLDRVLPDRKRRGSIAAELAFVLPILCLITFGSVQVANTIHFKQGLTSAVFEGTRIATGVTANRAKIQERVRAMLDGRNVTGATITILPAGDLLLLPAGTQVSISVTAPLAGNVAGSSFVQFSNTMTVVGRTVR